MGISGFGGSATYTAAQHGLAGVAVDGVTRDVAEMQAVGLPVARQMAPACRMRDLFPCPRPLFTAWRRLGDLRDDPFADDLNGAQDVLLALHHEPNQHMRGPERP
jgi:hypothetical protein